MCHYSIGLIMTFRRRICLNTAADNRAINSAEGVGVRNRGPQTPWGLEQDSLERLTHAQQVSMGRPSRLSRNATGARGTVG